MDFGAFLRGLARGTLRAAAGEAARILTGGASSLLEVADDALSGVQTIVKGLQAPTRERPSPLPEGPSEDDTPPTRKKATRKKATRKKATRRRARS